MMGRLASAIAFVTIVPLLTCSPAFGGVFAGAGEQGCPGRVMLQVPYGIENTNVKQRTGLMVQGSRLTAMVMAESYHSDPLGVTLILELPKPLKVDGSMTDFEIEERDDTFVLSVRFILVTEFDNWHRLLNIVVPSETAPGRYPVKARAHYVGTLPGQADDFVIHQQAVVQVVTQQALQNLIAVPTINIPADMDGRVDGKREKNCLVLRHGLGALGQIFGVGDDDNLLPVAFAAVRMVNHADADLAASVGWTVLDPQTKKEVDGFRISREFLEMHGGGDDRINTQLLIPAGQKAEFTLPVYADRGKVMAGRYLGRVDVGLFGSDFTLASYEFDLAVRKMSWSSVVTTLYAMGIALGLGIFLLIRHPALLRRFKTRWLVLVALFGATKFLVSLVPRIFLNELLNGLLGPFACFATGLIREGISSLFIMTLVVLVPLPGVVTLSLLMSTILTCLMGNFNPLIILFMVVTMSTSEIVLYVTGFTRAGAQDFTRTRKALIRAALGMGVANAFATFVDYNLYMLLYRLFYAKWFVWANIIVVGLIYSAVFAPAGVMLGNKLQRTAVE
jgi:hypothetical protein